MSNLRRDEADITSKINPSGNKLSVDGVANLVGEPLAQGELDSAEGQNSKINFS